MPTILKIKPAPGITAGIWRISEPAEELLSLLSLAGREEQLYRTFGHELRKRQWLACRVLLKQMMAPVPASVHYNPNGKPLLDKENHAISFSHAGDLAAVAISDQAAVGIDIEKMKVRIERVKERFLTETELNSISGRCRLEHLYLHWCGKEALYKLTGEPGLDFRNDIHIHPFDYLCHANGICRAAVNTDGSVKDFTLFYRTIEDHMLVVAV